MVERQHRGYGTRPRGHGRLGGPLGVALGSVLAAASPSSGADAGDWKSTVALTLGSTVTDNIGLAPRGQEQSEISLQTSPSISLTRNTGRFTFRGLYAPTFLGYVNDTMSDTVANNLNANATYQALERFLYLDARANITQTFLSPFGAQPSDLSSQTSNRTETRTIGLAPYIRGRLPGGGTYVVRDDYSYTTYGTAELSQTTSNRITANVSDAPGSLMVLSADLSYSSTEYKPSPANVASLARGRVSFNFNSEATAFATAGYEDNDYGLSRTSGAIYGGGFQWKPSARTTVNASSERRYFGNSLNFDVSHRTRMSVWSLRLSRGEQSFQGTQSVTSSYNTRELLNSLFSSLFPDPTARSQEVDKFMRTTGLPESLNGQSIFIAPRITRVEAIEPSVAFNGVRNSVFIGAYRRETIPVSTSLSSGLPDPFSTQGGFRQTGFNVNYSYALTPRLRLTTGIDRFKTESIATATSTATNSETRQTIYRFAMTQQLSARSTLALALRRSMLDSGAASSSAVEHALVGTFTHRFF